VWPGGKECTEQNRERIAFPGGGVFGGVTKFTMPPVAVSQVFAAALQHHRAGRLAEAEAAYRQILAVQPRHTDARQLLGLLAHQTGRNDLAMQLLVEVVAIDPHSPGAHAYLGGVYRSLGRLDEAIVSYRRALELGPAVPEIHNNLGNALRDRGRLDEAVSAYRRALELGPERAELQHNLGMALAEQRRLDEATVAFRRAVELKPEYPEAFNGLGNALSENGSLEEAVESYRAAIALRPDSPDFHNNLGMALAAQERFEEAVAAYHRSMQLNPALPEVHNNCGIALAGLRRLEEAAAAYRQALQLRPDYPEALNNLGAVIRDQGDAHDAIATIRQALALKPAYPEALNNLGNALRDAGRLEEAVADYRRALELRPDYAEVYSNLGNVLRDCGRLGEAIAACHRAIELKSTYPAAHNNLGNALRDQGRLDEAAAAYHRAIELQPAAWDFHNNLGNVLKDQGRLEEANAAYRRALECASGRAEVHSNVVYTLQFHPDCDAGMLAEEERRWNERFSALLGVSVAPHPHDPDPERRLRVGYVSANFRDHVVGRNLVPLFRNHDRASYEVLCYSGVVRPDAITEEIRRHTDQWRDTASMSDEALAEMIRQDGVDILVDLTQHMAGNRLLVFARRPAPVQVSFAGYPAGTGVDAIGYRISDRWLEGENGKWKMENGKAERVFLIESFWCYDPCGMELAVGALPAAEDGRVTFGNLNNFCKINDGVLELWARVLRGVPDSRLVLLSPLGGHRQRTWDLLERNGIAASRVEFVEPRSRREYLELYHRLDVVLDSFPYGGHTTSLDALWMGVPVVSLTGERSVSRAGLSMMSNLGLPEWVASTKDEYVAIAARSVRDLPRLAELRRTLRHRMESSVLMDGKCFARGIETAYREMWKEWCASFGSRAPGLGKK